ncbi:SCO1860 family LAETG-anchored protein [Streptomyces sp. Ag109_G2-15]|uniref:SCO1860 family LAETG-anchored protein n=1 Tax=Streptomyces sp. Ag109_G2-15 TaxID=1938850 RepID=UPI000BD537BB|nr:SCO1860 family LAETG-anchored protein [Streptomyces sp. Ag109_G2-15]SOD87506.1 LPXTG-motif cell wall anchor domain-containing protein [Streptomyces sp. Ag109_G2-15]
MNSNNFRMPARRLATVATVTALAAGPAVLGAGAAHATTDHGRASAVVLRTGLDVSLLNKTVNVPLAVTLNEVQAPESADRTALSARLDGVNGGKPFTVLGAEVASARATVDKKLAEGSVRLAHARLYVPGLPLLSLVEVGTVTAKATCEVGKRPVAAANVLGAVTVLGKRVTLTAGGPTEVKVPGVGEVRLDLSQHSTTTRTAAATALELKVSVNPLKLNVAEVEGTITLAKATCESPMHAPTGHPAPSHDPASDVKAQGARADLAETGGSSATPYIAGGALALVLLGGGAVTVARRRKS